MHAFVSPFAQSVLSACRSSPQKGQQEGWTARVRPQPPLRSVGSGHRNAGSKIHTPIQDARFKILDLVKKPVPEIY